MEYQKFGSVQEALRSVPFKATLPDSAVAQVAGLRRACLPLRWRDPSTDLMTFMYTGLTPGPGGNLYATQLIVVFQGRGSKVNEAPTQAPTAQHGSFRFADGREALWARGIPQEGWKVSGPSWVVWKAKQNDATYRVNVIGFEDNTGTVKLIAQALALAE